MKKFFSLLLFGLFIAFISAPADAKPFTIVTTFSILGDLTKQVGGDLVEIKTLVKPDSDAHIYKPTPSDSMALAQADFVIENGLGFEGWVDRLILASGYKGPVVIASRGVVPLPMGAGRGKIVDPHAWQDVSNTRLYVKNIAEALGKALPEKREVFEARAKAYDAELGALDAWVKAEIGQIPAAQRKIITSHEAFGYFGTAYGVTFLAVQGVSTEIEPTAAHVAKLVEQMKVEKIRRLFFENKASQKLISQLAKDAGASLARPVYSDSLSGADGPAATYIAMLRTNTEQFKEAMMLNGKEEARH
jgi:zinc/manganese transport system substrate-binding protein